MACVFIVVNEVSYRSVSSISERLDDAVAARIAVGRVRATVWAAESAQRGLLLTGRPAYRESYQSAHRHVAETVDELQRVITDRPQEAQAVRALMEQVARKMSELDEVIKRLDADNRAGALELVLSDIGREQMAEIDRSVTALTLAQNLEMQTVGERRDRVLLYSRLSILGLLLVCLAALLTTMRLLRYRAAERLSYLNSLRAERDKLEATVISRTQELTDLTRHLQTVSEDERSHLARELHDELGGLLTAAKLDLARMRSRLMQAGPEVGERVAHLHATLDAGIALKRRIIEDLRPSSLDNLGLGPALRILCQEWQASSDIPVQLDLQEMAVPPERSLVIYRLVQEALTNIAKYANASAVSVTLAPADAHEAADAEASAPTGGPSQSQSQAQAVVQVQDNGRGFAVEQRTPGHGLAGMRFRVASIGGELTVVSVPGQGTTIRARLPLHDQHHGPAAPLPSAPQPASGLTAMDESVSAR